MEKSLTFEDWKKEAAKASDDLDLLVSGDMWDDNDPYDLVEYAKASFATGVSPRAFVEEIFEDDLAQAAHDAQMTAESLEHEDE